jgi:hypothetical protein
MKVNVIIMGQEIADRTAPDVHIVMERDVEILMTCATVIAFGMVYKTTTNV